jgi:hypothetical protein
VNAPCMAVWQPGQWRVTVTAPDGGTWVYDVIGAGDRPSHGWFAGTPWAIYPGAEWEEADGTREPAVWTVPVFPESLEAARELGVPGPAGEGGVTGRLVAARGPRWQGHRGLETPRRAARFPGNIWARIGPGESGARRGPPVLSRLVTGLCATSGQGISQDDPGLPHVTGCRRKISRCYVNFT